MTQNVKTCEKSNQASSLL